MKQLEEIFRFRIPAMLKRKGKIVDDLIQKLMNRRHSGFSVYAGNCIARDEKAGQEALAHYIMRNAFAEGKHLVRRSTSGNRLSAKFLEIEGQVPTVNECIRISRSASP